MPCNCCEMENNTFGEATSPTSTGSVRRLTPLLKGEGDTLINSGSLEFYEKVMGD